MNELSRYDYMYNPLKPFVGEDAIYVPSETNPRFLRILITKELFIEAYNKWIKEEHQNESEKLS